LWKRGSRVYLLISKYPALLQGNLRLLSEYARCVFTLRSLSMFMPSVEVSRLSCVAVSFTSISSIVRVPSQNLIQMCTAMLRLTFELYLLCYVNGIHANWSPQKLVRVLLRNVLRLMFWCRSTIIGREDRWDWRD
jgi:hypothetical protein